MISADFIHRCFLVDIWLVCSTLLCAVHCKHIKQYYPLSKVSAILLFGRVFCVN